jgi:hypothetical protein
MKPINLKVKTSKFKFDKDCDFAEYKKLCRRVKKLYKADDVSLRDNKIIAHYTKVVGTWKSKRIDGVIIK